MRSNEHRDQRPPAATRQICWTNAAANALLEARRRVRDTDARYRRQLQECDPEAVGAYIAATKAEQRTMRVLLGALLIILESPTQETLHD